MALVDAKMEAMYKSENAWLRSMTSAFPECQFMSQEDFLAYVAWPSDEAQSSGGTEASGAATMEEDDNEDDEDKDEEDDDEDLDDSRG